MIEDNRKTGNDQPFELESQFVLRLPPTPSAALRAAVRSGVMNLEDRLSIQLENDMRHATVQFDKWTLPAKLYDLPTIIESCKTLDRKIFYKTADICQIMIAQEGDAAKSDEEVSPKKKDKDNKDKRYMLPHGITAPLKNVRKRRFRKTLKKKYVDLPDVEKEVKRLLRTDTEALSVRYEVVNAEDEKAESKNNEREFEGESLSLEERELSNSQAADVAEYDIFGEVLSSSEESGDDEDVNVVDIGQAARKLESIIEEQEKNDERETKEEKEVVDLAKSMQLSPAPEDQFMEYENESDSMAVSQLESATAGENLGQLLKEQKTEDERLALMEKLRELEHAISNLQAKRRAQELEVVSIENQSLKQKFHSNIERLKQEELEKQVEYDEIMKYIERSLIEHIRGYSHARLITLAGYGVSL